VAQAGWLDLGWWVLPGDKFLILGLTVWTYTASGNFFIIRFPQPKVSWLLSCFTLPGGFWAKMRFWTFVTIVNYRQSIPNLNKHLLGLISSIMTILLIKAYYNV
jgi:hypothetical protein